MVDAPSGSLARGTMVPPPDSSDNTGASAALGDESPSIAPVDRESARVPENTCKMAESR